MGGGFGGGGVEGVVEVKLNIVNRIGIGWATWRQASGMLCTHRVALQSKEIHTLVTIWSWMMGNEEWTN